MGQVLLRPYVMFNSGNQRGSNKLIDKISQEMLHLSEQWLWGSGLQSHSRPTPPPNLCLHRQTHRDKNDDKVDIFFFYDNSTLSVHTYPAWVYCFSELSPSRFVRGRNAEELPWSAGCGGVSLYSGPSFLAAAVAALGPAALCQHTPRCFKAITMWWNNIRLLC